MQQCYFSSLYIHISMQQLHFHSIHYILLQDAIMGSRTWDKTFLSTGYCIGHKIFYDVRFKYRPTLYDQNILWNRGNYFIFSQDMVSIPPLGPSIVLSFQATCDLEIQLTYYSVIPWLCQGRDFVAHFCITFCIEFLRCNRLFCFLLAK